MASLLIRDMPESVKTRLRIRAARNGRSMAAEARELIKAGLASAPQSEPPSFVDEVRRLFAPLGGVELDIPPREIGRRPPDFS